mmetsp:Transcript_16018/g.45623  ORF Transcript_16018/g.45623 Transcript_16018/m.45623 type:complete len:208 (+) Transcript_16018:1610-2233(+)
MSSTPKREGKTCKGCQRIVRPFHTLFIQSSQRPCSYTVPESSLLHCRRQMGHGIFLPVCVFLRFSKQPVQRHLCRQGIMMMTLGSSWHTTHDVMFCLGLPLSSSSCCCISAIFLAVASSCRFSCSAASFSRASRSAAMRRPTSRWKSSLSSRLWWSLERTRSSFETLDLMRGGQLEVHDVLERPEGGQLLSGQPLPVASLELVVLLD